MITCDFRLKVFYTAAKELNFTKAARELCISQPAVSKNIQELELQIGQGLFVRNGNRLLLTAAGEVLLNSAEQILSAYEKVAYELELMKGITAGTLNIGASTTISQYIIPQILASFRKQYTDIDFKLHHGNTLQVENWIANKQIHIGFIEGLTQEKSLKYTELFKDQIVLVAKSDHSIFKQKEFYIQDIKKQDLILREHGSGTNAIIMKALYQVGIEPYMLHTQVHLASSESIKEYLLYSESMAFLSIHAIHKEVQEGKLRIIQIQDFDIQRNFFIIHQRGEISGLAELFMKHALRQRAHFIA